MRSSPFRDFLAGKVRFRGYCSKVTRHRRTDLPVTVDGAIDWSGSPVQSVDGFLRLLNSQPSLRRDLVARTTHRSAYGGRPRIEGDWAVAYLAFVVAREPAISRWHGSTDVETWRRFGFASKPTYDTVHHHFASLEDDAHAFRIIAARLIQRAVEGSDGLVGRDVHVDGTETETNSRLYHDCPDEDQCPRNEKRGKTPLAKATTVAAHEQRQSLAEEAPDADNSPVRRTTPSGRIQLSNGCWYRMSDPTAGVRIYQRGRARRFWLGFNNLKAVDHYTGAVIATDMINASTNEADAYPDLLNQTIENTNRKPRAIIGDRGFSLGKIFEMNTRAGIASVFPYRKNHHTETRESLACDEFDQHGIPRCRRCGAPGEFESFATDPAPRLWFTCAAGCGRSSISCSKGYRNLLPLWRTTEAYVALKKSHSNYERAHWRWRDQWLVAPDSPTGRIKRRGRACHNLRAQAAMLIEWLLVCYQEGWLGSGGRQNPNRPYRNKAQKELRAFIRSRVRRGLHLSTVERPRHANTRLRAGP